MTKVVDRWHGVQQGAEFGGRTILGKPFYLPVGRHYRPYAVVQCRCGSVTVQPCAALKNAKYGKCVACRNLKHGEATRRGRERLHVIWWGVIQRCTVTTNTTYKNYGARGIKVCSEWQRYEAFRDWAKLNGYDDSKQIDRIDNSGNYEPSNCRWVSTKENLRNRRNRREVLAFGESKCVAEWAEDARCKCHASSIYSRLNRGWDAERAIETPEYETLE